MPDGPTSRILESSAVLQNVLMIKVNNNSHSNTSSGNALQAKQTPQTPHRFATLMLFSEGFQQTLPTPNALNEHKSRAKCVTGW